MKEIITTIFTWSRAPTFSPPWWEAGNQGLSFYPSGGVLTVFRMSDDDSSAFHLQFLYVGCVWIRRIKNDISSSLPSPPSSLSSSSALSSDILKTCGVCLRTDIYPNTDCQYKYTGTNVSTNTQDIQPLPQQLYGASFQCFNANLYVHTSHNNICLFKQDWLLRSMSLIVVTCLCLNWSMNPTWQRFI